MKLLIVEDNSEMRKLIRSIIADNKDSVFECENGSFVIDVYTKEHPDYVLMDINMPVMNGIECTTSLKIKFPNAKVIIISNYIDDEIREEAEAAGAAKYFSKDNLMEVKDFLLKDWVNN